MTIGLLKAGVKGDPTNSTGKDIADTVNGLMTGATPIEAITLAGLPKTAGAPDGYGDLAKTLTGLGAKVDPVKTVDPVDFFPINCYESFGLRMYGQDATGSAQVVQVDLLTKAQSNYGVALPITGLRNIKAISNSVMIAEADGGTGIYKYYKTTDSGDTWSLVLTEDFADVRMLTNRSMCIADIGGQTVLLFGEYNFNPSRTNGSTNDRVRLLRSDDLGSTWSEVTHWNTDGSNNNIRHIHAVKQNPNNGRIYVITGDSNSQSSIYSWDGVSAWPVNVNPADVVQSAGLKNVFGRQAFRTVDLLFKDDLLYTMPDAPTGGFGNDTECGIWTISAALDLTTLTQVSTVSTHMTGISGWLAEWLPDGRQVWLGGNENLTAGEKYNCIILSNSALTEWASVGAYRATNVSTYITPLNLFIFGGDIYVSCSTGSGKSSLTTVSCRPSLNDFRGAYDTLYTPDTIHPVYWVDSVNGSNANDGWTPRAPFKSAVYALAGGRVTYGGRLQVIGSRLELENTMQPVLNGNAREGDPTEFAAVQGDGATTSQVVYLASAAGSTLLSFTSSTAQKIEFRDISVKTEKAAVNGMDSNAAAASGSHNFRSVRCIWGDFLNNTTKFNRLFRSSNCPVAIYGSIIEPSPSVSEGMLDTRATGLSNYYMESSVFRMGNFHTKTRGASNVLKGYKCQFVGAYIASIQVESGASFSEIDFLDCDWWTAGVKSSKAVNDLASLTWTGQFKRAKGNQPRGVAAAFDGYSVLNQGPIPLVNYAKYVY